MKLFSIFAAMILFANTPWARAEPLGAIQKDVPLLPTVNCGHDAKVHDEYRHQVLGLISRVKTELQRQKKDSKRAVKENEEQIRATMTGGMQVPDKKKMKKMSREERKAYAMQVASQMMANPDMIAAQQEKIGQVGAVQAQQSQDAFKLIARFEKFKQQLEEIDNDPKAKELMKKEILPLRSLVASQIGAGGGQEKLQKDLEKLHAMESRYCKMLAPRQLAVLREYENTWKTSIPEFNQLDEREAKVTRTMGSKQALVEPGYTALEQLKTYLTYLEKVYQYDLKTRYW